MSVLTLTEEQKSIVEYTDDLYERSSQKKFTVDAPAGTGKSFLTAFMFERYKELKVIAPTHKACSVLHKTLQSHSKNITTIHRFLKAQPTISDVGDKVFECTKPDIENTRMIIVDECSMVKHEMFDILMELPCTVIFFGHHGQLPPIYSDAEKQTGIDTKISPTFRHVYFTLTKNMRSEQSIYTRVLLACLNFVENGTRPDHLIHREPIDDMLRAFVDHTEDCICITFTNTARHHRNTEIRKALFGSIADDYVLNEKLIFRGHRKINNKLTYYSSDVITITELDIIAHDIYRIRCPHQSDLPKDESTPKCKVCGHPAIRKPIRQTRFYRIIDQHGVEWNIPYDGDERKYMQLYFRQYKDMILRQSRGERKPLWVSYYNDKDLYMPSLNYAYASTCHTAQGSQYKHVYIDIRDVRRAYSMYPKLLYTAVSRMQETVHFI